MQTQTLDKKALFRFVKQGRLDCFRSCSIFSPLQGAAFHSSNDGSFYYSSGIAFATCNGIVTDQKELSLKEIESGMEFFQTKKLPFIWWTSQNLENMGFKRGGVLTGIAADISGFSSIAAPFQIRAISKLEELHAFCKIVVDAFEMTRNIVGQYQAVYGAAMHHNEQIHYLAFEDDIPVGTITLSTSETAGIWNLSVHPEHRNKGIGSALITTALTEARKLGYSQVMGISPEGMTFTKLGFQKVCEFPFYTTPNLPSPF